MLLKKLTEASGVSGNENEIRNIIIEEIKDHVDSMKIDALGNLIVFKKGREIDKKIMLAAHMDEVGLIVSDIDDMGLIKFMTVGGIDKRILVSKEVYVGEKKILGVIGAKPIHLQKRDERLNAIPLDSLYIDIGAKNKEDAEKKVAVGDYIIFATEYEEFGQGFVKAKALDDRVGCGVLINMIKEVEDVSFYAVFSVMEEVGLVGAGPAAYEVDPDVSIIVEGTVCYEMPKLDSHLIPTSVNKGPAISLMDRTTLYNRDFREKIEALARDKNIPYQYRKTSMGGNDSGKIHTSRLGSVTTGISIPCRNIHSTASVMSLSDYENANLLVKNILLAIDKGEI